MSVERCPACGYRNQPGTFQCINCSNTLVESVFSQPALPPPARRSGRQGTTTGDVHPSDTGAGVRFPAVVAGQRWEESPYQAAQQERALEIPPFEELVYMPMIDADPAQSKAQIARLPFAFALFRPALAGTVTHIEVREQINDFPNFFGALLAILGEIVWAIPNVSTTREAVDRIEVTKLRIQTDGGATRDALIRGSQRGANLSMGDYVSLWGHQRRGNLVVRKGYDHTSCCSISTRTIGAFLPALLILLLVAGLYLSHQAPGDVLEKLKDFPAVVKQTLFPFLGK